ncbi:ankyrin repeat [Fusarium pseudocircinatum]|uniref:Ankyrin repeat n=1 Tax=Fusarium pseudocircinatum TaxID=56676 RepID=A0A8H5NTN9_9HYPO|nr:ankyrin repeat [Fusarium pseudocircinatum]
MDNRKAMIEPDNRPTPPIKEPRNVAEAIWEWQADAHHSDGLEDKSVTARLCDAALGFYKELLRHLSKQLDVPKLIRMSLQRTYSLMVLWSDGYGVREGELDDILAKSRNIRRAALKILSSIANILLDDLAGLRPLVVKFASESLDDLSLPLIAMCAEASYLIHDDTDSSSDSSSDGSLGSKVDDMSEIIQDLRTDVECLVELDPLVRNPVPDTSSQKQKHLETSDWVPQQAFCDKVEQRFPGADKSLILRLGEANWLRYRSCQELRLAEEEFAKELQPESKEDHKTVAGSRFHDSGLGTSLPTMSSYAETVMTYSGSDGQRTRIPRLSEEAKQGKRFPCVACGRRHLYSDLQPYLCLETECDMSSFRNRNDWVSHLALEHYEPDWKSISCPLCFEITEQGKSAITRHLASHLEEISLSAIPSNPDEDASDVSFDAEAMSNASRSSTKSNGLSKHFNDPTKDETFNGSIQNHQDIPKEYLSLESDRVYQSTSRNAHVRFTSIDDLSIHPSSFRQSIIEAARDEANKSTGANLTADSPAVNHDSPIGSDSEEPYTIKCICNFSEDDGNTIYCETCDTWQHIRCFYLDNEEEAIREDFAHSCAECKPRPLYHQRARDWMLRHK